MSVELVGVASLRFFDGTQWPASGQPAFWIETEREKSFAESVKFSGGKRAADYSIQNDFVGWRYQQLARPAQDPVDYGKARSQKDNTWSSGLASRSACVPRFRRRSDTRFRKG